jgi:hypothetical protein
MDDPGDMLRSTTRQFLPDVATKVPHVVKFRCSKRPRQS